MTESAKVGKQDKRVRTHITTHRDAIENPKVRELINTLRRQWDALHRPQRGDRLMELMALGCSRRGLERALKQSATSIRRYMVISVLPEDKREAIVAGASAKKILEEKASDDRRSHCQQRVIQERKTGAHSNELATMILEFCRAGPLDEMQLWPMISQDF